MTYENTGRVVEGPAVRVRTHALEVRGERVRELCGCAPVPVVHRARTAVPFVPVFGARALTRDRTAARLDGQLGRTFAVDVSVAHNGVAVVVTVRHLLVSAGHRDYAHGQVEAVHLADVEVVLVTPSVQSELSQGGRNSAPLLTTDSSSYQSEKFQA